MRRVFSEKISIVKEKTVELRRDQRKVLKMLALFFAFMVAFTVLSRITYNLIIPKAALGKVEPNTIEHTVSVQGEVKAVSEVPVFTKEGLLIDAMKVSEGQRVNSGEVLYTIERQSLDNLIYTGQSEVNVLSGQIKALQKSGADSSEIAVIREQYNVKNKELEGYKNIRKAGYAVRAKFTGVVTKIRISTGEKTAGTADLLMADEDGEFVAAAQIGLSEESKYIGNNTKADITFADGTALKDIPLKSVSVNEGEGVLEVRITLPESEMVLGQMVDINLKSSSKKYKNCIPRTALHMDSDGYFVYGIKKEETILGEENTVIKFEVTVLDKNLNYAAVEGISEGQNVIVNADKSIEENNKVRILK